MGQELLAQAMMQTQNPLLGLGGLGNDALLAQALMVSSAPTTSNAANLVSQLRGAGGTDMSSLLAAMNSGGGNLDDATKQLLGSLTGNLTSDTIGLQNSTGNNQDGLNLQQP